MDSKLSELVPVDDWHKVIENFNGLYAELRVQSKKIENMPNCLDMTVRQMLDMWAELDALSNRLYDNMLLIEGVQEADQ